MDKKNIFKVLISLTLCASQNSFAHVDFDSVSRNQTPKSFRSRNTSYLKMDSGIQNKKACKQFVDYAQNNMNTLGLIVLQDGKSKIELYANNADKKTKIKVWSISKLFSGFMLGAQVKRSGMSVLDKSLQRLGVSRTSKRKDKNNRWIDVTLRNVWNMSSGIDWCEYTSCRAVDAASMIYGKGNNDGLSYVLNQHLSHKPGSLYRYSAGNYVLLQAALKSLSSSHSAYLNSPYTRVLKPLGASRDDFAFEVDGQGLYWGGSGLSLNTRTFSKLGQLLLNKGKWNGKRIFTSSFYNEMVTNSKAIKQSPADIQNWEGPAGSSIWLNDDSKNGDGRDRDGVPAFFPTSPRNMMYGGGHFGQFLFVYPSSKLVVARLGGDRDYYSHTQKFSELALRCFSPKEIRKNIPRKTPRTAPVIPGKKLGVLRLNGEGILSSLRVKELCSCLFVSEYKSIKQCDKAIPTNVEFAGGLLDTNGLAGAVKIDWSKKAVTIMNANKTRSYTSTLHSKYPQLGCSLKKKRHQIDNSGRQL